MELFRYLIFFLMLLGFFGALPWFIGLAACAVGVLLYFRGKKKVENAIESIRAQYAKIIEDVCNIIKAICAEAKDAGFDGAIAYMEKIEPHQFIKTGGERNIHIAS